MDRILTAGAQETPHRVMISDRSAGWNPPPHPHPTHTPHRLSSAGTRRGPRSPSRHRLLHMPPALKHDNNNYRHLLSLRHFLTVPRALFYSGISKETHTHRDVIFLFLFGARQILFYIPGFKYKNVPI